MHQEAGCNCSHLHSPGRQWRGNFRRKILRVRAVYYSSMSTREEFFAEKCPSMAALSRGRVVTAGFSLLEVLLAWAVLMIGVAAIASLQFKSVRCLPVLMRYYHVQVQH